MTGVPTFGRPAITAPTPSQQALGGRWVTPLLACLALLSIAVPFLIVEEPTDAGGRPGSPGSIVLTEAAPTIPGKLDLVFLIDRSTSYEDDLPNMARLVPSALAQIGQEADLRTGVASFIDGTSRNPGFRVDRKLDPDISGVGTVIRNLPIGDVENEDWEEMALSALMRVLDDFEFRVDAQVVVLVTTDAASKQPAGHAPERVGDAYAERSVRIAAIFATESQPGSPTPTFERQGQVLAERTGGSVQELSSTDSADIDQAILAGLENLPVQMAPRLWAGCPLEDVAISPDFLSGAAGGQVYEFELSYRIAEDAPAGSSICTVDLGGDREQTFELRVDS